MPFDLPGGLLRAAASDELVLFIGSGFSKLAGAPLWGELLATVLRRIKDECIPLGDQEVRIVEALAKKRYAEAADAICEAIDRPRLYDFLDEQLLGLRPTKAHKILPDLRLAAILTTNYDNLLEKVFPSTPLYTQHHTHRSMVWNKQHHFCIVKAHGDIFRPEELIFGAESYEAARTNSPYQTFLETLFVRRTVLFIGCSVEPEIRAFLERLHVRTAGEAQHYALLDGASLKPADREFFKKNKISVVSDPERPGHPDIQGFLEDLKFKTPRPDEQRSVSMLGTRRSTEFFSGANNPCCN